MEGSGSGCWHCIELKFIKELFMDKLLSIEFPWVKNCKNSCKMRCHLHCDSKKITKNPASSVTAQGKNGGGVQLSTVGS